MKKIISLLVFLSFILSISVVYAKTINDWERKVYYEATDRVYELPEDRSNEEYNRVLRGVAEENGLTFAEMKDIVDRAWDYDLTDREYEIVDDLYDGFDALPKDSSEAAFDEVYREVARKYGIPVNVLYDIEERDFYGWW